MAWNSESRKRVEKAEYILRDAQWSVRHYGAELAAAEREAARTALSWYLPPILWAIFGAAGTIFFGLHVPDGAMKNGGNWAGGAMVPFAGIFIFALVFLFDNKRKRADSPDYVAYAQGKVAEMDKYLTDSTEALEHAKTVADRQSAEDKRFVKLQDSLLSVQGYLENAAGEVAEATNTGATEDEAWANLAAERGWSPEVLTLMRGAEEAVVLANA